VKSENRDKEMKAKTSFFDKTFFQTSGKVDQKASRKKVFAIAIAAIVVVSVAIAAITSVEASISTGPGGMYNNGWIKIAYILFGVSLSFFVVMIIYIIYITITRRRVKKENRIIEILKEAKRIEKKIKGEGLTSAADIVLSQVLYEIRSTRSEMLSLILFGIGILFSLSLAIIAMLFTMYTKI